MMDWFKKISIVLVIMTMSFGSMFSSIQYVYAALDVPQLITFQGKLTDDSRITVEDGSYNLKFAIYDSASSGTCLWSADDTDASSTTIDCASDTPDGSISVTVTDGVFNVLLGDTTGGAQNALPDDLFDDNSTLYLGLTVGSDSEMTPRMRLASAPYAMQAGDSDLLDGMDSTAFLASSGDTATGNFDFTSAVMAGASPLVFEGGTANDFETTFAFTDPTDDQIITFQDGSGTVAFTSDITQGLWETGIYGVYEDDSSVIIGADADFTYLTDASGDLRVTDDIEVLDEAFIGGDLVVGASTASTETITNAGFVLNGDDLFVAGMVGIEGNIYTDGALYIAGATALNGSVILGSVATDILTSNGTWAGASPFVFEGSTANEFETTFTITDPTDDRTITFQNGTGTVAFTSDITSTVSGATDTTIATPASGHILIWDGSDSWDNKAVSGDITIDN
ncbi:MAG: hypothetical protein ABIH21_01810, partial [Patescibacteria group bacterium]